MLIGDWWCTWYGALSPGRVAYVGSSHEYASNQIRFGANPGPCCIGAGEGCIGNKYWTDRAECTILRDAPFMLAGAKIGHRAPRERRFAAG